MAADRRTPKKTVRLVVSGRRISDKVFGVTKKEWDDHKLSDTTQFDLIRKSLNDMITLQKGHYDNDALWKANNQEALDNMKNLSASKKILLQSMIALATIGGGLEGIHIIKSFIFPNK